MFDKHTYPRASLLLGLILTLASGLTACGSSSANEIRIGIIAPRSGDLAASGEAMVNAAQLVVQEVNNADGLQVGGNKFKVVLVIEDDEGNPEKSVIAAQKLINQENVAAIVGPPFDRNAIPVSIVAESAHVPMISPMSTDPQTTAGKQYVFRATFTNAFQGQVMARFAIDDLGAAKDQRGAAVLYDVANVYNRGIAEMFKQELEKAGGRVAVFESYTTGQQDFSRQLATIAGFGGGINVIILPNYPQEVALQVKQIRQMGIFQTIMSGDVLNEINPADYPELDRVFLTAHWHPKVANEASKFFTEAYRTAYSHEPTSSAALTFDSVKLILQAIQYTGQTDTESIREGLTSMGAYEGVSGVIEYKDSGNPVKSVAILQIKNGEFVFFKMVSP